jgi:hypothetical protein
VYLIRFLIALVCFAAVGVGIYGVGRLAGCGDDNRDHLVAETTAGQSWLRHPLGFELRHPGADFVADPALAARLEGSLTTTCDAFTNRDAQLVVCTTEKAIHTRAEFVAEIDGARRGIAAAARQIAQRSPGYLTSGLEGLTGATTITDDVSWDNGRGTAVLHAIVQGVHVRLEAFTIDDTLVVLSATGPGLDAAVESFARR